MSEFSVHHFLDIEAIVAREDEEDDPSELLDDEDEVLDGETETISRASANIEAQDLEDEALGQEADVVFQICCWWSCAREIHPPAITSAFALSSIPGYVFIEASDVTEARHAVNGLVTVRDKHRVHSANGRKRDGWPAPHLWTATELGPQQYGQRKVKVLGSN
ncbi:hypothetical protein EDB83DRAFT_2322403, partial [Lactarius deliciosus]